MSRLPGTPYLPGACDHVELTWEQFLINWRENMTRLGLPCDLWLAIRDWDVLRREIEMMRGVQEPPQGPLDCPDEGEDSADLSSLNSSSLATPLFTETESTVGSPAHDEDPTLGQLCITLSPYSDVDQLPYSSPCPVTGDFHVAGPPSIHTDAPVSAGGDPLLYGQTTYNYLASFPLPLADSLLEQSGESVPPTPVPPTPNTCHNAPGLLLPENIPALQFQDLPAGSSNEPFACNDLIFDYGFWSAVQNPACHFPLSAPSHTAVPHPTTSTIAPPPFPSPILPTPVNAFLSAPGSAGQFGQNISVSVPPHLWDEVSKVLGRDQLQTTPHSAQQQNATDTGIPEVIIRGGKAGQGVNVWFTNS